MEEFLILILLMNLGTYLRVNKAHTSRLLKGSFYTGPSKNRTHMHCPRSAVMGFVNYPFYGLLKFTMGSKMKTHKIKYAWNWNVLETSLCSTEITIPHGAMHRLMTIFHKFSGSSILWGYWIKKELYITMIYDNVFSTIQQYLRKRCCSRRVKGFTCCGPGTMVDIRKS